ncbi:hypothetical protein E2I00_019396, partial [Balaenoptera physalus]
TPTASQGARRVSWALPNILNTDSRENLSDPFAKSALPFPSLSRPCTGAEQSMDHAGPGDLPLHAPPPAPPALGPLGLCDVTGSTGAPVRKSEEYDDFGKLDPWCPLVQKRIHFLVFLGEIKAFSSSHRPRALRTKQLQGASALTAQ